MTALSGLALNINQDVLEAFTVPAWRKRGCKKPLTAVQNHTIIDSADYPP
jgi:hypothetical protein